MELAKSKFNVTIYATVSDNASNMNFMGKETAHALWSLKCNSHTANLLSKDCFKENEELLNTIQKVQKKMKMKFHRQLKNLGGKTVILSCETRWGTVL